MFLKSCDNNIGNLTFVCFVDEFIEIYCSTVTSQFIFHSPPVIICILSDMIFQTVETAYESAKYSLSQ